MLIRSTLRSKILILVILPVVIEIGALAFLSKLLTDTEVELEKSIRSQRITACINSISKHLYETALIYALENSEGKITQDEEENLINSFLQEYFELDKLTKDDPKAHRVIMQSKAAMERTIIAMREFRISLERDGRADSARAMRRPYWYELRRSAKKILTLEFLELKRNQSQVAKSAPIVQAELRQQMQYAIWGTGLTTSLLTLLAARYLTSEITNKVSRLKENTIRLASSVPLQPEMKGEDDLSQLDQVFHQMADELHAAARKERALVDNTLDLICSLDRAGKFVEVNPASVALLGYSPQELLGSHLIDFLPPADVSRVLSYFDEIKTNQNSSALEMQVKHKDGTSREVDCSAQFVGELDSTFCVFHDSTERKQVERLKQEVMAMVTHDLRTPLATVSNVFDFLNRGQLGELNEKGSHFVISGQRNVKRMISLINDLLDIEKIKSGNFELEISEIALNSLLKSSYDLHSATASAEGIELVWNETDLSIHGDNDKLQRLLSNLIGNAIKFTPREGKVSVSAILEGDEVHLIVADTGTGIPRSQLSNVFERFQQVESTAKKHEHAGSGLGLAICKQFAEIHGGRIWVESEEGKGSLFIAALPRVPLS